MMAPALSDLAEKLARRDQRPDAVRMVLLENVILTPLAESSDIDLGAERPHAPCHLQRRTLLLGIARSRR